MHRQAPSQGEPGANVQEPPGYPDSGVAGAIGVFCLEFLERSILKVGLHLVQRQVGDTLATSHRTLKLRSLKTSERHKL